MMAEIDYDDPRQMLDAFVEDLEKLLPGDLDMDAAVTAIIFDWFATILGEGDVRPSDHERLSLLDHLGDEALADLKVRLQMTINDIYRVQVDRR